jgi:hypothetical protein
MFELDFIFFLFSFEDTAGRRNNDRPLSFNLIAGIGFAQIESLLFDFSLLLFLSLIP